MNDSNGPYLSSEECRELDRRTVEEFGVPGLLLMEHASIGAAMVVTEHLHHDRQREVHVLCGPGNNGGDGFAVARHLDNAGYGVTVTTLFDPERLDAESDAGVQWRLVRSHRIEHRICSDRFVEPASAPDLWVDALFGTGLARPPEGRYADAIEVVNASDSPTVAIDIPSGLDANRGVPLGPTVRAAATATFGAAKAGFAAESARTFVGELSVVSIGIPRTLRPAGTPGFPPTPRSVD